jgi:RNA polymerase sigma-70 factor (ECF subfamily)
LIDLMYFKGYTQSEIAEEFNIPLGTVKTRLRSATMNLRKIFVK